MRIHTIRCHKEKAVLTHIPISRSKWTEMEREGLGPRVIRIGTCKLYRETDLVEWLEKFYGSKGTE
jgi:hypothetical protein